MVLSQRSVPSQKVRPPQPVGPTVALVQSAPFWATSPVPEVTLEPTVGNITVISYGSAHETDFLARLGKCAKKVTDFQ